MMAAPMLKCFASLHSGSGRLLVRNYSRTAYTVLLPEIPDDTPETNPLMRVDGYPAYKSIDVKKHAVTGIAKRVIEFESGISRLEEKLSDPNIPKTFENVIEPIEKLSFPISYCWNTFKNLNYVKNSEDMTNAMKLVHPLILKARVKRFQSVPIYNAVKELSADKANLSEAQDRVVQKYILESKLNGVELTGYDQYYMNNVLHKLGEQKERFRTCVQTATNRFKQILYDREDIIDMPQSLLRYIAADSTKPERGPWVVTLQPTVYLPVMEYCSNRDVRENVWFANQMRASSQDQQINNSATIQEIRFQKRDQAKLVGFDDYAQMSMATKMAGSVENVLSMIASLKVHSEGMAANELSSLQEFANERGFDGTLEAWDVPYWRRKQKHSLFQINDAELMQYFPMEHVLNGLFKLCGELFGITVKQADGAAEVWDSSVRFFNVYDEDGTHLSSLYLDPYSRPLEKMAGAWVESGRSRSDVCSAFPLAYLNCNVAPPVLGQPALMSFSEVKTLFHEFGHALQHLLTGMPYSDVAGLANVEWDAVEICSTFMENWLYDKTTMGYISCHVDTGATLPDEMLKNLIRARRHMAGHDMMYQLYLSAVDIELYTRKDFWLETQRETWAKYMLLTMHKKDAHLCSFTQIFAGEYPAAYYSYKWSEMMSADVFSAFEEAGLDNRAQVQAVGRRFRDTFLHLSGGCHPGEVFRRFRGRDPSPDALLKTLELS
ncbi:PREDICTED: probable cytosolic oligopeptidase A [Priapulus caudatus]|uniref:oligopeptidase A n=1 Tax=Priapulus caudatus TaxID=37621 RepID=A0ABM1EBR8_PRICU|nr:PREDICTED: probable cytosolic oligopeptidase A [Priapulus caudatus]